MNEIFLLEKQNVKRKKLEKEIDLFNRKPRNFLAGLLKWKINWPFFIKIYFL